MCQDSATLLERQLELKEIWATMFEQEGDKSPGSNDFIMEFFKRTQEWVKNDVMRFSTEFYKSKKIR